MFWRISEAGDDTPTSRPTNGAITIGSNRHNSVPTRNIWTVARTHHDDIQRILALQS